MQLRYRYRLHPTPAQQRALAQAFGCARVVFNDGLRTRQEARQQGLPYISPVGPPRFRSKKDSLQTIRFTKNARFSITAGGRLRLPKIGDVRARWSRPLPADPSSVTVIKDAAGRYFASFVVEVALQPLPLVASQIGIDLGLSHFAVTSDGDKTDAPRFLRRAEKKLKRLQRALSRKVQGSNNRAKARLAVARQHAKVADARRDFHHQLSTKIIRENQTVIVEDLAVKALARTRLAKSMHDAGWSSFVGMLAYKAALYGRDFHRIDRWFPSSKRCSACGGREVKRLWRAGETILRGGTAR